MTVRVITAPAEIVSVADAKQHLRVGFDDDDALIKAYIASATQWLDGPAGWLGRALGPQTLELMATCWRDRSFRLPYGPVIEVVSVTYADSLGSDQVVDIADYSLLTDLLWFRPSWSAPALGQVQAPVRIRYRAGYEAMIGDPAEVTVVVPEPIRLAILMLTSHYYHNREAVSLDAQPGVLPLAVDALLSPFRIWSI